MYPKGNSFRLIGKELDKLELHPEKGFIMKDNQRPVMGVLQVRVKCPDSLYLPALPVNSHGRMVFGLCSVCIEEERQDLCNHTDEERDLTSTWTSIELENACQVCNYQIVQIYEAFLYDEKEALFKDYYTSLA